MTEEQQKKLSRLKAKNKERLYSEEVLKIKNEIYSEIPDFDNYFRFSTDKENKMFCDFMSKIPALTPSRPDFERLPYCNKLILEDLNNNNCTAWLVFTSGSEGIFDVNLFGKISDFMRYYYEWEFLSPEVMFVFEDMNRFIFIDDECTAFESCLKKD